MNHRPGHSLITGGLRAEVWPGLRLDALLEDELIGPFTFGSRPTPIQDAGFIINQIVEIAVRELSPGVNDPFTVISCLDHLGATLCHLAERRLPSSYRCDDQGDLRVIDFPLTFADMTLDPIRLYGREAPMVLNRMLVIIALVLGRTLRPADIQAMRKHAGLVVETAASLFDKERSDNDALPASPPGPPPSRGCPRPRVLRNRPHWSLDRGGENRMASDLRAGHNSPAREGRSIP